MGLDLYFWRPNLQQRKVRRNIIGARMNAYFKQCARRALCQIYNRLAGMMLPAG